MKKIDYKDMVKFWIDSSDDAMDTARRLMRGKKYVHAMFFVHLAAEKMLKGVYVNHNKEEAPIGHNLQNLAAKINNLDMDLTQKSILAQITTFNIAARYDDYKQSFYKSCDAKFAREFIKKGMEIIVWLKSQLA